LRDAVVQKSFHGISRSRHHFCQRVPLTAGKHTWQIEAIDARGQTSRSRLRTLRIDSIAPATMRALTSYDWPGNIRELANVIERAVIGTSGETLRLTEPLGGAKANGGTDDVAQQSLETVERNHIIRTLLNTGWRVDGPNGAARILGLNPSTLRGRIRKLGIRRNS